uniref:VIN3-2 n=1 Tax=Raphanus sativus TaxID=3726 RepID=I7F750_RAPSA|nr:VIN3-2 [Raphanus sativus]
MQAASLSKIWRFDSNVGPEEDMDPSSFQVLRALNFPKKKGLSVSERRELIHALSKQPEEASELLNSWSRNEIMKIICAEMGKERNYTGLTKPKLIENLLSLVSRPLGETSCPDRKTTSRRKKKKQKTTTSYVICCENLACRAALGSEDTFCRRCSCCVCQKFDDNKDPSLWIACEGCGLSCHLECALKEDGVGVGSGLDGRFHCVFCGKDNDLLGCWRKQVKVAKETRRVDVLCYRVSLGQKLLRGTRRYYNLLELMDEAVKKLEGDVGPLVTWEMKMARGIVNRLASGAQVQKLCSLAMEAMDKMVSPPSESVSRRGDMLSVRVEEIQAKSAAVRLDSDEAGNNRQRLLTNSSTGLCCNPYLPEDESNNVRKSCCKENDDNDNIGHCSAAEEVESELEEDERLVVKRYVNEIEGRDLIITPCKRDTFNGKQGGNKRSKSRTSTKKPETNVAAANAVGDKELSHIVKTIRCLEQEGHIDKSFRERFLTWYSLKATHREVSVVKVFVETFMDDLSSLGQQLVHTFSECMLSKRSSTTTGVVPGGICLKLWH